MGRGLYPLFIVDDKSRWGFDPKKIQMKQEREGGASLRLVEWVVVVKGYIAFALLKEQVELADAAHSLVWKFQLPH